MAGPVSPRLKLPLLVPSQSQKEITHNEALLQIDAMLHLIVIAIQNTPPATLTINDAGKCWIIGTQPTGIWQASSNKIAQWTGDDWRIFEAQAGVRAYNMETQSDWRFLGGAWSAPAAVAGPTGGTIIDVQARSVIDSLLTQLRLAGTIPA
jgi:hypothetical protein